MENNSFFAIAYLAGNLFRIYVIYEFLKAFLKTNTTRSISVIRICAFCVYFVLNSAGFLCWSWSPNVNLITFFIAVFLLSLTYRGNWRNRIIAAILIPAVNIICEDMIYRLLLIWNVKNLVIIGIAISSLAFFMIMLIVRKLCDLKRGENIALSECFLMVIIPAISIFISAFVLDRCVNETAVVYGGISMLLLNVLIFFLFEHLLELRNKQLVMGLLEQQNQAYENHIQLLEASDEKLSMFRHDIRNHFSVLGELAERGNNSEILNYLGNLDVLLGGKLQYVSTGNPAIDSLINIKLDIAKKKWDADIEVNIIIPEEIKMEVADLSIIIGNLLDNAINALEKCNEERFIHLWIRENKSLLHICVENSYNEKLVKKGNELMTTNRVKKGHGIGLKSVRNTVEKYNGELNISYSENIFTADALIYMK